MRPDEAVEASRCIWRCFEYSYPYEDIFHPDRVRAMIDAGQLVSAVAEAEGTGIVGHVGLKPVAGMPRHKEVSMLAVEPRFRRDGLAQRLTRFIVDHGATLDLDGLVAEAVTTHPGSQAVAAQVGLKPCALLVGEVPPLDFKGFDGVAQRESLVLCYRPLRPRESVTVRVPPHLEAMTAALYAEIGLAVRVETGSAPMPDGACVVDMEFSRGTARLQLLVLSAGGDLGRRLASVQREGIALRADVLDILVRLEDEAAPATTAAAEELGARFIGLRPATAHGDLAVFRLFLGREVELGALKLFTRTARRLREGIAAGWPG
jgi:serine/threonine-protein kinase RsbW